MDTFNKPNLKRFREILLKDQYEIDDNVDDYSDSDSDTEYEVPTNVDESDDTSTDEHISEQSDSSDSDIDGDNIIVNTQPATLQKGELTWSSDPSSVQSRTPAANIMKKNQAKENKKPVILLSSLHNCPETYDDDKQLPCAIHDYNQTKCGVDIMDQCINYYTVRRITRRWPMAVFFNMIDIATINSMTIWLCQKTEENRKSDVRCTFLKQLSKSLTDAQNRRRSQEVRLMPKVCPGGPQDNYKVQKSGQPRRVNIQ
ncbi:unnamed protein product [Rotaria sordida]|uniref:PiggyBac transposable element-derived protein domain-containing protein n=1 Tax=Rotaria sordida TaxID=392033 RepID=A0A815ZLW3_9BILA|nr:unnamed protein product [Rotaria sordida]CAF1584119.1 unnamed protein product [Rotaria sordida]